MIDEKRLVKAIRHSAYIFADNKLKVTQYEDVDSPDRVERCLNCPFEECFNCYENKKWLIKEICSMRERGESVTAICKKLGFCRRTFYYLTGKE